MPDTLPAWIAELAAALGVDPASSPATCCSTSPATPHTAWPGRRRR